MTKPELVQFLKENMGVRIEMIGFPGGGDGIQVTLLLCGEEIATAETYLPDPPNQSQS